MILSQSRIVFEKKLSNTFMDEQVHRLQLQLFLLKKHEVHLQDHNIVPQRSQINPTHAGIG